MELLARGNSRSSRPCKTYERERFTSLQSLILIRNGQLDGQQSPAQVQSVLRLQCNSTSNAGVVEKTSAIPERARQRHRNSASIRVSRQNSTVSEDPSDIALLLGRRYLWCTKPIPLVHEADDVSATS